MIEHTANTANTLRVEELRKLGTKTTKAACGRRIASSKFVSRDDTNCPGCVRQIQADEAQAARMIKN
jgi:hypothetical protein